MIVWERFPRAPIAEALLDIQVTFPSPVELSRLEAFHEHIRDRYPSKEERVKWTGEIQLAKEAVQQAIKRGTGGFLFKSKEGQRIVQARQDGYTFNWLKPYDRWETFRDEAHKYWVEYRSAFGPEAVARLGLRYINRVELPLPFGDFREYILTAPDIAPGLPQGLSALFMRLEIPHPGRALTAIVTETIEPPVGNAARLPFILDIDIVREATFDPASAAIWETFEAMRDCKNEIFFASLTEKAKELFR